MDAIAMTKRDRSVRRDSVTGMIGAAFRAYQRRAACAASVPGRCLLALALWAAAAFAAEDAKKASEHFHWPAWQIPATKVAEGGALAIQPDDRAESKREVVTEDGKKKEESVALLARVSRRAIAKGPIPIAASPVIEWKDIRPGVYRVSARVKFEGPLHVIGTPITLSVLTAEPTREDVSTSFTNCDFRASGEYEVISFLYEVDPTLAKRLPERRSRHPWGYPAFLEEVYPGWKENKPKAPSQPPRPKGISIALGLDRTKYCAASGLPPNSMNSVSLDWIDLQRVDLSPSITVRYVDSRKRWLRPGEENRFDIGIENFTDKTWTRELRLVLEREIAEQTVLSKEQVSLQPGEAKVVSVQWKTTPATPIWGYEARAEIRDGEKVESSARDYVNVHPEVYSVLCMGTRFRRPDPFRERVQWNNLVEVFAATEGDCAGILPSADQWLCGMSEVVTSYKIVQNVIQHNAEMGVATHMYLFAGGTGTPILDLYVLKPEYFPNRITATDQVYRLRRKVMDDVRAHDFNKGPFEMPKTPHVEDHMNYWFPELMDRITKQAVEFIGKTGYMGIRFDVGIFSPKSTRTVFGEPLPVDGKKSMEQAAKNFEGFRAAIMKEWPQFEWGANMDSWAYLEQVGKRDSTPPPPEDYPEFVAFAKAHGLFMDEGTMSAPLYDHYMNRFEDALWAMVQKREAVRKFGGVYQLFSPHRDGNGYFANDDIYWAIMIVASGSYYVGCFSPPPYSEDSIGHFVARFGEFFRSKSLRTLLDARDRIFVDSPSELWYADTAVWEDIGPKRRYVIPLINPPTNERLRRNKANELPAPIEEPFNVEIKLPEGFAKAKAWMLTWEPRIAAVPLQADVHGDKAITRLPGIGLFRTLVVEFEK